MKSSFKSLMMAIPLLTAFATGQAFAEEAFKQKVISCNGDNKKILGVVSDEVVQITFIVLSASADSTVKVNLGGDRILQLYMAGNDSFQTSLTEVTGKPGQNIVVSCTGGGDLSISLVYSLSPAT